MADTITRNSSPTVDVAGLLLVEGYDVAVPSRNIVRSQMESADVTIIYRAPEARKGTLILLFGTAAAAHTAAALLVTGFTFTLTADETAATMTFAVPEGDLRPELDRETRRYWLLQVPFHEVIA
jgi:hypothetical protein